MKPVWSGSGLVWSGSGLVWSGLVRIRFGLVWSGSDLVWSRAGLVRSCKPTLESVGFWDDIFLSISILFWRGRK